MTHTNSEKIAGMTAELKNLTIVTTKFGEKIDRWNEIYATKQELRLNLDDLRQEFYKDLGYRRNEVESKLDEQKKTINKLEKTIMPLKNYSEKRRRDQVIFYSIVFVLSLLGSSLEPEMIEFLYKLF